MKYILAAALVLAPVAALAGSPQEQALAQMVQEALSREASALTQVYALQGQVKDLQGQIAKKGEAKPDAQPEK